MWTTIVEARSVQELESLTPLYSEIPAGTPILIRLELQWYAPIMVFPGGKLADLAGAEWWAPRLAQADLEVIDVRGNWHWMEIEGRTRGTPVVLIIAAIVGFVAIFGLSVYISNVRITANIEQKKLEQADEWLRAGYTPGQVSQMLGEITFEPTLPTPSLPTIAGISVGVIGIGVIILFLILRK